MKIIVDNVYSRVENATPKSLKIIQDKLSCWAPNYQFTAMYKRKRWNGKVAMFHSSTFLTGLLPFVESLDRKESFEIIDSRSIRPINLKTTTVPLRAYQWDAVNAAFSNKFMGTWWPRGVIKISTGGGKTQVASAMIQMADVPTLFVVNTKDLLWQAHRVFTGYDLNPGVIGDNHYNVQKTTVATIQSLYSLFNNDPSKIVFLKNIQQVFFDEAHLVAATVDKGNIFTSVAAMIPAPMRFGLTATPFMKDQFSNWLLEGITGQQIYEIKNKELIEQGYLSEGYVTMFEIPNDTYVANIWPNCYDEGVVAYPKRNDKIVELIATKDKPILILVQREGHGTLLSNMCKDRGLDVPFVFGKNDSKERIQAIKDLRKSKIPALIASTIFDQGVDIPEIRTLILAGGGKSPVRNLQRLGRGLRVSEGKNSLDVYDFYDYSTKWLKDHSKKRKDLWISEGFKVELKKL